MPGWENYIPTYFPKIRDPLSNDKLQYTKKQNLRKTEEKLSFLEHIKGGLK